MAHTELDSLNHGFRERYLDDAALGAQLEAWAERFPDLVRRVPLAKTPEGRTLWLLEIGPEPDRIRPAVWVDGNMHASELCGANVALAIAEDVIRLHLDPETAPADLPAQVADRVRTVLFYVLPRMSPDGAERVLTTGQFVRSVPRDDQPGTQAARWRYADIDGDGLSLTMRQQDPTGEFVSDSEHPDLMRLRLPEDPGPYFKLYPEGTIDHYDGRHIPDPARMSDNRTDLNRNFPWSWMPEDQQHGAGILPLNEPESRAVADYSSRHPNIFAWLNLHTFGGVFIRPPGHQPDNKMNQADLAVFRQIAEWNTRLTGYPTVSGFEEFTYQPDTPLHGDLTDYAYHQRGCIAYVCELWDLFRQIDMPAQKRFVDHYTAMTRDELLKLGRWDREHNQGRIFKPWRAARHPQLGAVEVGGLDPRFGIWNPPAERLDEICRAQSAAFLRVAALSPMIELDYRTRRGSSDGPVEVELKVRNTGYLGTQGLASAGGLHWNEPLYVEIEAQDCQYLGGAPARMKIGHLDGWGRGLGSGAGAPHFQRSRGSTGSATVSWTFDGAGRVLIRVGACRVGWIERVVELA